MCVCVLCYHILRVIVEKDAILYNILHRAEFFF